MNGVGSGAANVDGVGALTYQRAIDIARSTEGELDPTIRKYLEDAVTSIWNRINREPDTYVLSRDEFVVFNYYIRRFDGHPVAQRAVESQRTPETPTNNFETVLVELSASYFGMPKFWRSGRTASRHSRKGAQQPCISPHEIGHHAGKEIPTSWAVGHGPTRLAKTVVSLAIFVTLLLSNAFPPSYSFGFLGSGVLFGSLSHHTQATTLSLLDVFQVYPPVLTAARDGVVEVAERSANATVQTIERGGPACHHVLAVHSFASSYGAPFVSNYTPPSCGFNRVTWNLTVTSAGRQYDRLGIMYLGGIEVFRTSTAEPTKDGIEWTYLKDMTAFLSLLKEEQTIIFDLGNLINRIYTAAFNVTLTASYFTAVDTITPADMIFPVSDASAASQNKASVFMVPPQTASSNLKLPKNVKRAVFTVAATGQSAEEFWWSNVPQSTIDTFPQYGSLDGYSPFREIQLFIDGKLAGVAWPFPVIFTGGVVPGLWRPIVGIDAFDLKEDEIDITPWLPLLCDGNAHDFSIRVSGLVDHANGITELSEMTDSYWWVTGKIFVWLDVSGHVTTGDGPRSIIPTPLFEVSSKISKSANGSNETLLYNVKAHRTVSVKSTINLSYGSEAATWSQDLNYSNVGNVSNGGNLQINVQHTQGDEVSSSGYAKHFNYALSAGQAYDTVRDNFSIVATVDRGKDVQILGKPVFPTGLESFPAHYPQFDGAWLATTQNGSATYLQNKTTRASFSFGSTQQDMVLKGIQIDSTSFPQAFSSSPRNKELFHRYVEAINDTVVVDEETPIKTSNVYKHGNISRSDGDSFVLSDVLDCRGRSRTV